MVCHPSSIHRKYTEPLCQTKANLTKKSRSSNFPPKHPPHFPAKPWRPRNLSFNIEAHVNRLHRGTETGLLCLFWNLGAGLSAKSTFLCLFRNLGAGLGTKSTFLCLFWNLGAGLSAKSTFLCLFRNLGAGSSAKSTFLCLFCLYE